MNQLTSRYGALRRSLLAVLTMVTFSGLLAQFPGEAGAAGSPGNLRDIDVEHFSGAGGNAVVARDGSGRTWVNMLKCSDGNPCINLGWTNLGGNLKSTSVELISGGVVVFGLASSGKTWFRRGSCGDFVCSWSGWISLGGNLRTVEGRGSDNCAHIVGLTYGDNIYESNICGSSQTGWSKSTGRLKEVTVYGGGDIFGTSSSGELWFRSSGTWRNSRGNVVQPVRDGDHHYTACGLSPSQKELWCLNGIGGSWEKLPGPWRRLDDDQAVGIGPNWTFKRLLNSLVIYDAGGSLNQVAMDLNLHVGISGGLKPWFSTLSEGWKPL
ncbi:MAG: hypothetical protein R2754_18870 [Microthrixaceae bacterium]